MFEAPSFFDVEDEMHGAVDEVFAEQFNVLPMVVPPNESARPDPSRRSFPFYGKFVDEGDTANLNLEEMRVSTSDPYIVIRKCQLNGNTLRRGDLILRCRTNEQYEVKENKPDTLSGLFIRLHQMGVRPA